MMTLSLHTADFSCKTNTSGRAGDFRWDLDCSEDRISLRLHSEGETVLGDIKLKFNFPFEKHDMLYLNGYQSWTDSRERGVSPGPTAGSAASRTACTALTKCRSSL